MYKCMEWQLHCSVVLQRAVSIWSFNEALYIALNYMIKHNFIHKHYFAEYKSSQAIQAWKIIVVCAD